ncbi:MAG: hypothetical protein E6J90_19805 [Deltaproteobacteria bacterium]|nr:MAG: hypothetical protein E6J90_19805 [Deltaproteobacteria bacterium]
MNRACTVGLVLALAAGCGDNGKPGLLVETRVPRRVVAAGEPIDARCAVLDTTGQPALDKHGNPLTDSVELTITYRDPDAFAMDADGRVIAARVGTATARCAAPSLDLIDASAAEIEIIAGPAVRVVTQLASRLSSAGAPVGVTCLAFDAFNNRVAMFEQALAVSPFGAGVTTSATAVTATAAGEYDVSCVVSGAAEVDDDLLVVVPALPSALTVAVAPERTVYAIDEQVTLVADARDRFGNRVDDVVLSYGSAPGVPSPSEAQFQFAADGAFALTATVTSPTQDAMRLTASRTVFVNSAGPAIQCMRADAPTQASEAYMLQRAPGTLVVPVHVTDAFPVQSVKINGTAATFNQATGNYEAGVPIGFGMSFVDVVATDQFGKENSTTCFVLAADSFTAEDSHMPGALAMRLDPNAISDPQPTGLDSLNDILRTILSSDQLRSLVDSGLIAVNPIHDGSCGFFACNPRADYNADSIRWDPPSSTLALVPGGLRAQVTLPNVHLTVSACGTTCCIGGSTITVRAASVTATVQFSLQLQANGKLRAGLAGDPAVAVGSVSLDGSGFCGFLVNLLQSFFTGTVKNKVHDALVSFINSDVAPLLDQLVSSLDINTLGRSFSVPRLDGSGNLGLQFGLAFSSFDITASRALLGIGTRFTPAAVGQSRQSLGVPRRTPTALLDPPGTSAARPVGLSLYEGVLNQVLHSLWRGGFFQAALQLGSASATIDARLPPVAMISGSQAQLMLGGIDAMITIPGFIDTPIHILFGGRATASVTLGGDALHFGNLTLTQLFVSFQVSLTQSQRTAMASFLTQILQGTLAAAINNGLPAFPIPTFALPASASQFGLPPGAVLGILNPQLSTSGAHFVLDGGFGVRQ